MLQPINLQLAHFNVEQNAQISKNAIAVAQQTAQGQEVVQETLKQTQTVQASVASSEAQKVRRRAEDDNPRRRNREKDAYLNRKSPPGDEGESLDTDKENKLNSAADSKGFDLYA